MGVLGTETDVPDTTPAAIGVKPGVTGEKWYPCYLCSFFYPESELVYFEGRRYCIANTCADDINGIVRERLANRNKVPKERDDSYRRRYGR